MRKDAPPYPTQPRYVTQNDVVFISPGDRPRKRCGLCNLLFSLSWRLPLHHKDRWAKARECFRDALGHYSIRRRAGANAACSHEPAAGSFPTRPAPCCISKGYVIIDLDRAWALFRCSPAPACVVQLAKEFW